MPNIKSAIKRVKTSEKRRLRNKAVKSRLGTTRRKVLEAIQEGNLDTAEKVFRTYCSYVDKAAKVGVIKKNNASRRKSRLAKRLAAAAASNA